MHVHLSLPFPLTGHRNTPENNNNRDGKEAEKKREASEEEKEPRVGDLEYAYASRRGGLSRIV